MAHVSTSHYHPPHPPLRAAPVAIPARHLCVSGVSLAPALLSVVHIVCPRLPATHEQSLRTRIPRPRAEPLLSTLSASDPLLPQKENLQISLPSPPAICARWPSTGYARAIAVGSPGLAQFQVPPLRASPPTRQLSPKRGASPRSPVLPMSGPTLALAHEVVADGSKDTSVAPLRAPPMAAAGECPCAAVRPSPTAFELPRAQSG
jgi:hypothetical protein